MPKIHERVKTVAIYKYRKELNMTQAQLAAIVGVVPAAITQYESGARKPDIVMLKKLAKALHTTADALLEPIEIKE
ncbi:MAG: helix-turn-helix transcriptional regulator [Ruminococcus sp.]|nr:helix-turn-helix transcriptional regulator [Ruminococcus sp.]